MAAANYYLCHKCQAKTFYDNDVDYEDSNLGAMAALCKDCAQTHEITIAKRGEVAELRAALWQLLVAVEGYDDHLLGLMDLVDSRYVRCLKRAEAAIDHARAALAASEGQP